MTDTTGAPGGRAETPGRAALCASWAPRAPAGCPGPSPQVDEGVVNEAGPPDPGRNGQEHHPVRGDPARPGNEPDYVAGTENFYVITRYNWSAYYAMAVIELGQQLAQARD